MRAPLFSRLCLALLAAGISFTTASCGVRPDVTDQERAAALTFTPPKGKALLYIYRESGGLVQRTFYVNREFTGGTLRGTFVVMPLTPGKYTVQACGIPITETDKHQATYPDIILEAKAGQAYFIKQTTDAEIAAGVAMTVTSMATGSIIPMLGSGLPAFHAYQVDAQTGRAEVAKLKHIGVESDF